MSPTPPVYGHWIDGREQAAQSGETLSSTSPLSGEIVARIAAGDERDVTLAAEAASRAAKGWAALSPAARSKHLHAVAAMVRSHAQEIADLEVAETGKPAYLALIEADGVAEFLEYYAGIVRSVQGATVDLGPDQHIFSIREPFGVIGVITPWNAPVYSAIRGVAPALAIGNTVIVKPSEFTSTTTLALARLATAAGLPDGVLNVVTGEGPAVGSAIVTNPVVGKVSFTGSVVTGRAIARLAAERLIPLVLELGGKSPHIVFADAPLADAAAAALAGFTMNTGQVCAAGTRLLVERSVHDEFVELLTGLIRSNKTAEQLGPIITESQYDKVNEYIRVGVAEGATLAAGRASAGHQTTQNPPEPRGLFIEPTVFTGVSNDMRIAQEEIFGPVVSVIPFDTEAEAVSIANDTEYGLVAGLWTRDLDRAFRVSAQIEAGQVFVNQFGSLDVETPFGGVKNSGYGREKGLGAFDEFSRVKSVMMKINR